MTAPVAATAASGRIAIPDTTLDVAITMLAAQTGMDIVSTETQLNRTKIMGIQGRMSAREALRRLLEGSPFIAVSVDGRGMRVVRRRMPAISRATPPHPAPASVPALVASQPIVVTASKRMSPLLRFPGSVSILTMERSSRAQHAPSMNDVAAVLPILQNTELGPGRNKIFIRGIADSSFNGPTQSTATVYLDETQLSYSGPDPDLKLYDIQRVEVLEGPQGTLYGAGAIGGIIQVRSNPVDLSGFHAAIGSGGSLTQGGDGSYDLNGMANLVLARDVLGVRAVAYRTRVGGIIDDPSRGLDNVDRVTTQGGRITAMAAPGDDWTIEAGLVLQTIDGADSQYADGGEGRLSRQSTFAQPFDSRFALGRVVVRKSWANDVQFLYAGSLVERHSRDVFDATRNPASLRPTLYENRDVSRLFTQEARLFRTEADGSGWLIGAAFLRAREVQSRSLGPVDMPIDIIGVINRTQSLSVFAEGTVALTSKLSLAAGGRLTGARTDGEPSTSARVEDFVKGRSVTRLDPTIALSWKVAPHVIAYARYQSGFRTGGLAVARGIGRVADFKSDSIAVVDAGLRFQPDNPRAPTLSAGISYAHWEDIQADLVDRRGLPYTANIGNARIVAIESSGKWSPLPGWETSFSLLYTNNRVTGEIADSSRRRNRRLAETPKIAASGNVGYHWQNDRRDQFGAIVRAHYVGRSVLGTGDYLDISQGQYTVLGLSGTWQRDRYGFSLDVENLGNRKDNRFSLGNPFMLATRSQAVPLRPLTVRIGFSVEL